MALSQSLWTTSLFIARLSRACGIKSLDGGGMSGFVRDQLGVYLSSGITLLGVKVKKGMEVSLLFSAMDNVAGAE